MISFYSNIIYRRMINGVALQKAFHGQFIKKRMIPFLLAQRDQRHEPKNWYQFSDFILLFVENYLLYDTIFQYCSDLVLIQRILISFEAILEEDLKSSLNLYTLESSVFFIFISKVTLQSIHDKPNWVGAPLV